MLPGVSGLAFGGGKYRCPGRTFAELEISLLALVVLNKFQIVEQSVHTGGTEPWSFATNRASSSSTKPSFNRREGAECNLHEEAVHAGDKNLLQPYIQRFLKMLCLAFLRPWLIWGLGVAWLMDMTPPRESQISCTKLSQRCPIAYEDMHRNGKSQTGSLQQHMSSVLTTFDTRRLVGVKVPTQKLMGKVEARFQT